MTRPSLCWRLKLQQQTVSETSASPTDDVWDRGYMAEHPEDQAWFWTPEWQAGEDEADADKAFGMFERHGSDDEFLASFEKPVA